MKKQRYHTVEIDYRGQSLKGWIETKQMDGKSNVYLRWDIGSIDNFGETSDAFAEIAKREQWSEQASALLKERTEKFGWPKRFFAMSHSPRWGGKLVLHESQKEGIDKLIKAWLGIAETLAKCVKEASL